MCLIFESFYSENAGNKRKSVDADINSKYLNTSLSIIIEIVNIDLQFKKAKKYNDRQLLTALSLIGQLKIRRVEKILILIQGVMKRNF